MQFFFLPYRSSRIHYGRSGSGNHLLCCFHGYGEDAESFELLAERLGGEFTLIAVELPFHGKTEWKEGLNFPPDELLTILDQIFRDQSISQQQITLAGYSMGGRIALALLERIPEKIVKLVLLAPDGLKMGAWYRLATQNLLGNRLFKFTMRYPGWFLGFIKLANAAKLVNPSVFKFAMAYLEESQIRNDLYARWTSLRKFRPSPSKIKELIIEHKITTDLVYGRFDRMIPFENGVAFSRGLESYCRLTVLPTGHQLLSPRNLDAIISAFYS